MTCITAKLLLDLRAPPLVYMGHKSSDFKYWLGYNKSSVLVMIHVQLIMAHPDKLLKGDNGIRVNVTH